MRILFSNKAEKYALRLNEPLRSRIMDAIYDIPKGDILKLEGDNGVYRLRVGDWRILFSYIDSNSVYVRKIAPRGQAYK